MRIPAHVRLVPIDPLDQDNFEQRVPGSTNHHRLAAPLRQAIMRTRQWLVAQQHAEGYWVGELEGDTILESETILLEAFLGRERSQFCKKAARYIADKQLASGGWSLYPGGSIDISGSVKAYFALKLTGSDPCSAMMQRARLAILNAGGADKVNSFTRYYLALLGQISYEDCPAVPPEMILLPKWLPINVYKVSAWSRTIIVPLSIISALRPVRRLDESSDGGMTIRELFINKPEDWPEPHCPGLKKSKGFFCWEKFFRLLNHTCKWMQRWRLTPLRGLAIRKATRWMLERFKGSDGLGAIYPPMVWSIIALKALGYDEDSPEMRFCREQLEGLVIEEEETVRLQPCKSPVWDTAITLRALSASGVTSEHSSARRAVAWLLENEIRRHGDWSKRVDAEPGGWCFEHANEFYPDVDDTAMVLMALKEQFCSSNGKEHDQESLPPGLNLIAHRKADDPLEAHEQVSMIDRISGACDRAVRWMLALQNRDGGWGAFDRDNDSEFLCHVPFADHNAMIDPSTPDLAARVLEALGKFGRKVGDPAVDRAVEYVRSTQEADGSWFGRWGVNYIYGTWQVLVGLREVGVTKEDPAMVAGAQWLLAHQQSSGGWGESPDTYQDSQLRGTGPTTASQTAWALLGLMAAGKAHENAIARGVGYLLETQNEEGTWDEPEFTGTGFPQVFYLRYHLYPVYFPLLALSQWAVAIGTYLDQADQAARTLADAVRQTH